MPDDKQALRKDLRRARSALLPAERAAASLAASQRLLALPELRSAGTVLLYAALPDEADPDHVRAVLFEAGARVLLPRVVGEELHLAQTHPDRALTIGAFGIREPDGPPIEPDQVDLAVLPGVAFDHAGGRLGQGGGFYDRLLPRLRPDAVLVGFGFACQLVPRVPQDPHDQRVDVVVTDATTHRAHASRADRT